MKKLKSISAYGLAALPLAALTLAACNEDDAVIASRNLSKAADNFEIIRNIVFYNTWTDTEVVSVLGRCSIEDYTQKLAAVCKDGVGDFKKHYLGRSENLSYFAVQAVGADVSTFHTRITWKPQSFLPDIDLHTSGEELLENASEANQ
ncbi:hypothetical protein [Leisingera aquimarina]|uniref:beta-sandwich lipoprotein n=1 Tax=Leisingera aquimarina TaxID=476529 RepID=UPI00041C76AB|nr:hypothetical protein [Leisingera aquimarina]